MWNVLGLRAHIQLHALFGKYQWSLLRQLPGLIMCKHPCSGARDSRTFTPSRRSSQLPPMPYPLHRQLIDGRSLYRIESADTFTEIQIVGSRAIVHRVVAHTYPEKVLIHELIAMTNGSYKEIGAAVFNAALERAEMP